MVKGTGSDPGWINKFFSLFLSFENLSSLFFKVFFVSSLLPPTSFIFTYQHKSIYLQIPFHSLFGCQF
uniref:Uncharacterized protein n=1 Tax=Meloidogyne enterolobii TaxID=390850 RepID=A0A6V7W212_MELEN|nr:unnamed protein product [Meloidogyne enterolobii]